MAKNARLPREHSGGWVWLAASVFYPLSRLLAKRINKGTERMPARGPVILVMNHISHLDPIYDAVFVHKRRRTPRFLAKSTLWEKPIVGKVLSGTEQIPVFRGTMQARDSLKHAGDALAKGRVVVVYPEGTITRDPDGWPMASRTGVGWMTLDNLDKDVLVLPCARWGTLSILDIYKKKYRVIPRARISTTIGEPVDLSEYKGKPVTNTLAREVTDLLMHKVMDLLGEIREEAPPADFYHYVKPKKAAAEPKPAAEPSPAESATEVEKS